MIFGNILRWIRKEVGNPYHTPKGQAGAGQFTHGDSGATLCSPAVVEQQLKDLGLDKHFDHRDWSMVMPKVSPKEFFSAYVGADNVTKENMAHLTSGELDFHGIKFKFKDVKVHDQMAKELSRSLDFTRREANHEMIQFDTAKSGGGIAKKLLRDCAKLYPKIGIDRISLFAGLELGAYTWAKFGFKYTDPVTASDHMDMVANNASEVITMSNKRHYSDPGIKDEIRGLATLFDLKDSHGDTPLEANQLLSNFKTPHLDAHFADDIAKDFPNKGTFMKWIMNGSAYDGVLDLKDEKQMAIFNKYTAS